MGYSTGTLVGVKNLFDQIVTFMTSNGWTLHDAFTSIDKVLKSTGTSTKQNHYIRLTIDSKFLDYGSLVGTFTNGETVTGGTSGATAVVLSHTGSVLTVYEVIGTFQSGETITGGTSGATAVLSNKIRFNTFLDPRVVENVLDWIQVRGYSFWNAGTHVGTGEHGQWGPWNFTSPNNNNFSLAAIHRPRFTQSSNGFTFDPTIGNMPGASLPSVSGSNFAIWDGIRKVYGFPNVGNLSSGFYAADLPTWLVSPTLASLPVITTASSRSTSGIPVWDKVNDRFYIYCVDGPTLSSQWKRWNSDTNAWETLGAPPAGHSDTFYTRYCWDGDDFIYCLFYNSAVLKRYQISTDTWTTLASAPEAPDTFSSPYACYHEGIYVPKGTIPAVTEDVIYFLLNTGSIRRYNVTSDTWASHISPPESAVTSRSTLWWDYNRYLYFFPNSNQSIGYKIDLQNIGGGWSGSFNVHPYAVQFYSGMRHISHFTGKVKSRAGSTIKYWLIGDTDSIKVVTKIGSNYYWSYFGQTDSEYKTNIATLSGTASPGSPATISVDSSTNFEVGDFVLFLDPVTGAITPSQLSEITNGTTVKAFLGATVPSGSRMFVDAINTFITGDSWMGTFGHDVGGFDFDKMASSYRIKPPATPDFTRRASPNNRGRTQLFPMETFASAVETKAFENRSKLRGVFVLNNAAYPAPQSEDIVFQPDGKQYIVFAAKHSERTPDDRLVAFGPIN